MDKKKFVSILFLLLFSMTFSVNMWGQRPRKFNPQQFEKELHQYITSEVGLTPREAAAFFPLFDEMQRKQRLLFDKMRIYMHTNTSDDKASLKAIQAMDNNDLQIKKLQKEYHQKFCKVLPAGKVLQILKADEKFHRRAFKKMVRERH
jgi:Spy/CpxP family protein refolding chaperone